MRFLKFTLVLAFAVGALLQSATAQPPSGYRVSQRFELGGEGGWDYLSLDASAHRLYIARATRVMVVDVDSGKLAGEVPGTNGVHGVALIPKLGRGVTSNGRDNSATIFDLKTLKSIATVKTGEKPDSIIYDKASQHVLAFNGNSNNVTVIDPEKAEVVATIALPGRPETGVADGKGKVFVNLEDIAHLAVIDTTTNKAVDNWTLTGCEEPIGLAMDKKNRRLFAGCHNKVMAVADADTGKVLASLPIGGGVDAVVFDHATQLAFSSNGEGTLTVVHEDSPDKFSVVENVPTEPGARTLALDSASHKIYLATAKFGPAPAATADTPRPKKPMIPDSFVVLVVSK